MLALGCLIITIAVYGLSKRLYRAVPKVYLSPILLTPTVVMIVLLLTGVPYETYHIGTEWLSEMIGPATVAMAVPLYKHLAILKKHALTIMVSVCFGSSLAIVSSVWLAKELHLQNQIIDSLALRSTTTPIAMAMTEMLGGTPAITAIFVLMTGLFGMIVGPLIIRLCRIEHEIARGVLFGTSAHTAGTSKAFEFSVVSGSISSVAMIVTAFFTLGTAPLVLLWLL
ncbi:MULTISPECIES: LrgB family protein [Paenibacillus]|uniref:LrgB family protein n=1 Tax=Paenibacillus baimaensis TaxID=2982185 RepID=A0ABT2UQW8_9BACL|nr:MULTISPECIES: LrgB family protein [unclassified Paenibacillus]MCU6797068.1 LrgB family protein [Paenibacillus sp. WQ 127069]